MRMMTLKLGKIVMGGKDFSAGAGMVPPIFIVVGREADCAAHPHNVQARHAAAISLGTGDVSSSANFPPTFASGGRVASRGFWSNARRRAASYRRVALFTGDSEGLRRKPGYAPPRRPVFE